MLLQEMPFWYADWRRFDSVRIILSLSRKYTQTTSMTGPASYYNQLLITFINYVLCIT